MGLEMGSRAVDQLDILIFLIVLLLRVSQLVLALLIFFFKLLFQVYNYLFLQGCLVGLHQEVLPTGYYIFYLSLKIWIFMMVHLQHLIIFFLSFPFHLW
jgi:hypothetical protein